ncbi:MAG: HAD-IC family P-type ATPase [Candidatus Bathyarchaeota archaeon]|nr:HAD-IC family P-type ATPase [Candidatus Bathyarchaeota archaeon]
MSFEKKASTTPSQSNVGLTREEVEKRIQQYGKNVVSEAQPRMISSLLRKFWGIVPWMLEVAIVITLIIGNIAEAVLIAILLVFQALLGFYREQHAKRAVALLKQRLSVMAHVKRDGKWQKILSSELVPDDLIHLEGGDMVPADIKNIEGNVLADQSTLTGESLPIEIKPGSTVYAGSLISQGEAIGIVTATGDKTYYGKTANLVRLAQRPLLLQRLATEIARYLLAIDILLAIGALIAMIYLAFAPLSMVLFILMLLVLSVPVALPAMSTLSATMGTFALTKRGTLTTRLSALEEAASMDVLCIDKTGTITQNRLEIEQIVPLSPYSAADVLRFAAFTVNDSTHDPINLVLMQKAQEQKLFRDDKKEFRIRLEPFDPETKISGAWISQNNQETHIIKGEPISVAKLTNASLPEVEEKVTQLSSSGARIIAVAAGTESQAKLVGFVSLIDPIRQDSSNLVTSLKNQGVRILLLTGDGKATAQAVAAKVGITGETAPDDITYDKIDLKTAERFSIFPRVLPQDKYYIVGALQKGGHVVGMTGDGVNDAPALSQANVGIAVSNATDVAKSAASLVMTQAGLDSILETIKISRANYQRMKTWILAMITRKVAIPVFIAVGLFIFGESVITPFLAFVFMLFGDIVTFSLSMDNVIPSSQPNRWSIRLLLPEGLTCASIMLLMSLLIFWIARYVEGLSLAQTQTIVFTWLVLVAGQAALYLLRARRVFWEKPSPGRWFLVATIFTVAVTAILAIVGVFMEPISIVWFVYLMLAAFGYLLITNGALLILQKS